MKNEIKIFENQNVKLEVNMKDETVWLNADQMAKLFDRDKSVISRHIKNALQEELDNSTVAFFATVQKEGAREVKRDIEFYNLDMIISVGYRVKSNNGVAFRKWANQVLKDYLIKGYAVNNKRLEVLEKTVQLLDIVSRENENDIKDVIRVINEYSKALDILDDYDHERLTKEKGTINNNKIEYEECMSIINLLKNDFDSDIFGLERNKGLNSIINNIYQTYMGEDVYKSVEEKAANFLYLIIKNHVFIDGNKRIGATLFIYFLFYYDILYKDNKKVIDNNTLASVTLLIALSNPKEKEVLINLITRLLKI